MDASAPKVAFPSFWLTWDVLSVQGVEVTTMKAVTPLPELLMYFTYIAFGSRNSENTPCMKNSAPHNSLTIEATHELIYRIDSIWTKEHIRTPVVPLAPFPVGNAWCSNLVMGHWSWVSLMINTLTYPNMELDNFKSSKCDARSQCEQLHAQLVPGPIL